MPFVEFEDGHVEFVVLAEVPASQLWFWRDRWQKMEREVDDHIARGEVETFDDADSFLASLPESRGGGA